jgi:phosphoserine aminotransferase
MDTISLSNYENEKSFWKVFSYSGGPTQLPRHVAHKVEKEFLSLGGSGTSILETASNKHQF